METDIDKEIDQEVSKGETKYPGVGMGLTFVIGLLFWGTMYFMVFK